MKRLVRILPSAFRPSLSRKSHRQLGVWPYAAVLMIAVAGAIATLAWRAEATVALQQQQLQAELAQRDAQVLASRLEQRLQSASAGLSMLAIQDRLITAFEQPLFSAQLGMLAREYQAALPDAMRVLLLPVGPRVPDLSAEPPIGYALLDMLSRAEQELKAPPPEIHLPGQPEAHVNLVQPVIGSTGAAVGHIVASYPLSWLQQPLHGGGGVSLIQNGASVLELGPAGTSQARRTVAGTNWQLAYTLPTATAASLTVPDRSMPLVLLAALLLLTTIIFYLLHRQQQDARSVSEPATAGQQVSFQQAPGRQPSRTAPGVQRLVEPLAAETADDVEPEELETMTRASTTAGSGIGIDPSILRAYDVRGIVGEGLTSRVVHALGRAIATEAAAAGQEKIVVARDGRLSSPELSQALIDGLVAGGRQVLDIGQVPTPLMHFATYHFGTGAGVMVTGSHNPRDYNGLKIVIDGRTLSGEEIQNLGRRAARGDFIDGEGSVRSADVIADYIDRVTADVRLHRPLRIVVDCGNGVAGAVAPQVFRALGCEVEELFCEVDGYFPNHHPDPANPANLDALISLVRLQRADLGLAFDGDGDRLGVVDARGRIIWPDRQLMLFARDVLSRTPGGHVVFDVKCSAKLADFVTELGGVPLMWKSGHSMIRSKMREVDAPLGGDMSGHIFLNDRWYGFDDAIYAGARVLEILSSEERGSVEMFVGLPDALSTPEIRIDLASGEAEGVMAALGDGFIKSFEGARLTTIDGIRVDLADGWGLVRASNTQPCLVLRFEADSKVALGRIQEAFRRQLLAIKPDLALPF